MSRAEDAYRVELVREGNVLFNKGQFAEAAKRFREAKYGPGLERIADKLLESNQVAAARAFYREAGSSQKIQALERSLAQVIQMWLTSGDPEPSQTPGQGDPPKAP